MKGIKIRFINNIVAIFLIIIFVTFSCFSCASKPVEYRQRSSLVGVLTEGPLPERQELSDKIIIWKDAGEDRTAVLKRAFGEDFKLESATEDGIVLLRPVLPQHVIRLMSSCLKDRKYDLIWDQLFTDRLRSEFNREEIYRDNFTSWCAQNKTQLLKAAGRILSMWRQKGVRENRSEDGRQVFIALSSFHSKGLKYSQFELIREEGSSYWKLTSIGK